MTKILRRLILCLALVSMPFARNVFADHIGGPGFAPGTDASGFYVGTYLGVPTFPNGDIASAAQLIPSDYDYSDLVLTVQLVGPPGSTVDFALAPDDSGVPGVPIGTASVPVNAVVNCGIGDVVFCNVLAKYTIQFPGASLNAGTWYWLVATSPDVANFFEGPPLPVWAMSPGFDYPLAFSASGPWISTSNISPESFAYELDGVRESDTFVSAGPPPIGAVPTPEPSSLLLVFCGFGMIAVVDRLLRKRPPQKHTPLRAQLRIAT